MISVATLVLAAFLVAVLYLLAEPVGRLLQKVRRMI